MQCSLNDVEFSGLFTIVEAGPGKVALLGTNGRYVSSENGDGAMTCNRTSIGWWERFDWVEFEDGTIGLRGNNGRYVSSENGGPMTCTRDAADAWEMFEAGIQGDANCDGVINLLDVSPFVNFITGGNYSAKVDLNLDGDLNLLDVAPFIEVLTGG